jgi:hypothetical protein
VLAKEIEGTAFLSRLMAFSDDPPGFGGQFSVQKGQLAVFIESISLKIFSLFMIAKQKRNRTGQEMRVSSNAATRLENINTENLSKNE